MQNAELLCAKDGSCAIMAVQSDSPESNLLRKSSRLHTRLRIGWNWCWGGCGENCEVWYDALLSFFQLWSYFRNRYSFWKCSKLWRIGNVRLLDKGVVCWRWLIPILGLLKFFWNPQQSYVEFRWSSSLIASPQFDRRTFLKAS